MFKFTRNISNIVLTTFFLLATYSLHAFTFNALLVSKTNGEFLFSKAGDNLPVKKKSGGGAELLRLLVKHNSEKRSYSFDILAQALIGDNAGTRAGIYTPSSISYNAPPKVFSPALYKRYCRLCVLLI